MKSNQDFGLTFSPFDPTTMEKTPVEIIDAIVSAGIPEVNDNDEVKFVFFPKCKGTPVTPASKQTCALIKNAIIAGAALCIVEKHDVDTHVVLQANTFLPDDFHTGEIPGVTDVLDCVEGTLRYEVANVYKLTVHFEGGGSRFVKDPNEGRDHDLESARIAEILRNEENAKAAAELEATKKALEEAKEELARKPPNKTPAPKKPPVRPPRATTRRSARNATVAAAKPTQQKQTRKAKTSTSKKATSKKTGWRRPKILDRLDQMSEHEKECFADSIAAALAEEKAHMMTVVEEDSSDDQAGKDDDSASSQESLFVPSMSQNMR